MSSGQANLSAVTVGERYVLERELGRGGMAVVYLGRDLRLGRTVAVKWLSEDRASSVSAERFLRETRIASKIEHPMLVHILDAGIANERPYYVMPYMEEGSLRHVLDRERQLPFKRVMAVARDIAAALDCLHSHGIVHRDVKPENILFSGGRAHLADFGIARAMSSAAGERLTATGMAVGTPAYMSPEQGSGAGDLDARSDIYSFGCVVYEMIAGMAPFVGPTPEAVIAQRFSHAPPELRRYRAVPEHIVRATETALSVARADRFQTAQEFVDALDNPDFAPAVATRDSGARSRRRLLSAGLALVLLLALAIGVRPIARTLGDRWFAPADTSRIAPVAIAPHSAGAAGDSGAARLSLGDWMNDALAEWRDLPAASRVEVAQAIAQRGPVTDLGAARQIGRDLGAGKLLAGDVESNGDTAVVRFGLYDVRSGRLLQERRASLSRADVNPARLVTGLIRGVLRDPRLPSGEIDPGDSTTRSFPAFQAYGRGRVALMNWELSTAARELERATMEDPGFAPAQLWLAQVLSWLHGDQQAQWGPHASRALLLGRGLSPRDSLLALGLQALARERFPEACAIYARLRARDSVDALAWYGTGECLSRDSIVVRDRASPSGWSFRASRHAAVNAYLRAVEIEPGLHAAFSYDRLQGLVIADARRIRHGRALAGDTTQFAAYPTLAGDTIAFVPQRMSDFQAVRNRDIPPSFDLAMARGRDIRLSFVTSWTRRAPNSADAFEALSDVLEQRGDLTGVPGKAHSAISALATANRLATDPGQRLRLGVREVRVQTKIGEFARAQKLADSLLAANPNPDSADALELRGIAALTGRVELAARLQRTSISAPQPIDAVASQFLAYASLGVCGDTLEVLERTLDRLLNTYADARQRPTLRQQLLEMPLRFAVPCLGPGAALRITERNIPLVRMQAALARGETLRVRTDLDALDRARATIRPGDVTLDHAYQEAWLRTAIKDTSGAIAQLDVILDALPTLGVRAMRTVPLASGLVRAMALRAELAAARQDRATAHRWSTAVVTLWNGSDPLLRPVVTRMQSIQVATR